MWAAILFILSVVVALAGTIQAFRLFHSTGNKTWLIVSAALLLLAGLAAIWAEYTLDASSTLDLVAGLLALVAAGLALVGVHLTGAQIQALALSEKQAQQSKAFFQAVFDHLPDPVVVKDREAFYRAANPAFQALLGKQGTDILGKKDADFFPRPQAAALSQTDQQAIQLSVSQVQEQEVLGSQGRKWLQITHVPISNGDGVASSVLVTGKDIGERKRLEKELEERKLLLGALVDEKQQIVEQNRQSTDEMNTLLRFERLLASMAAFFIDADAPKINQGIQQALRSIGLNAGADYCGLLLFGSNGAGLKPAFEWAVNAAQPPCRLPGSVIWRAA